MEALAPWRWRVEGPSPPVMVQPSLALCHRRGALSPAENDIPTLWGLQVAYSLAATMPPRTQMPEGPWTPVV